MNEKNMKVLTNIIGAVESGGQVYGQRNYKAYAAPYTNSAKEYTVTLGWAQNYGDEAYRLISLIYAEDPAGFEAIDKQGNIKEMINGEHDWVKEKWFPSAYQRSILIKLIDSDAGHKVQDELFEELMTKYIGECEAKYTKEPRAVMMYCEIRHLGGKSPACRIFDRCGGVYTLDNIMTALKKDQEDRSSSNQVGDAKFWSRHVKCREFAEKYAEDEGTEEKKEEKAMAYSRTAMVKQMQAWIGKNEADGSYKAIIDAYNAYKPWTHQKTCRAVKMDYSWAWCACTVSAAAIKSGNADIVPLEISCYYMIEAAKKMGCWTESDTYTPKPGDLVIYNWKPNTTGELTTGADHVGCVESVSGSQAVIIEGNASNQVKRRTITVGKNVQSNVRGWVTPKYTEESTKTDTSGTGSAKGYSRYADEFDKGLAGTYYVKASDGLNVRDGATVDAAKLGTLANGSSVKMYGYHTGEWYYVTGSGLTGFVNSKYLTKKNTKTSGSTGTTKAALGAVSSKSFTVSGTGSPNRSKKYTGTVTADALNVRAWAGKENNNIKTVPVVKKGEKIDVCDSIQAKDGKTWYYAKVREKAFGFVSAEFVTLS